MPFRCRRTRLSVSPLPGAEEGNGLREAERLVQSHRAGIQTHVRWTLKLWYSLSQKVLGPLPRVLKSYPLPSPLCLPQGERKSIDNHSASSEVIITSIHLSSMLLIMGVDERSR